MYRSGRFSARSSSCCADLIPLIQSHGLCPHLYADNTQIYVSCRSSASLELQSNIISCVDDVASWMRSNRLQLNTAKTEILWSATGRRSHQLPQSPLRVGNDEVMPVIVVRDLGICIDADVSVRSHLTKTISGCFAVLRQPRSVHLVPVISGISRSDTTGPRQCHPCRNPTVPAETAPVGDKPGCPAGVFFIVVRSAALSQLHWLKAAERIDLKLAVLVCKCLHGVAPSYLADELCSSADFSARRRLRSVSSSSLVVRRTRLSTISDRAVHVAAAHVWNGLPQHVTSAPSLSTFRSRLKTRLFQCCFP